MSGWQQKPVAKARQSAKHQAKPNPASARPPTAASGGRSWPGPDAGARHPSARKAQEALGTQWVDDLASPDREMTPHPERAQPDAPGTSNANSGLIASSETEADGASTLIRIDGVVVARVTAPPEMRGGVTLTASWHPEQRRYFLSVGHAEGAQWQVLGDGMADLARRHPGIQIQLSASSLSETDLHQAHTPTSTPHEVERHRRPTPICHGGDRELDPSRCGQSAPVVARETATTQGPDEVGPPKKIPPDVNSVARLSPLGRLMKAARFGAPDVPEETLEQIVGMIPAMAAMWGASNLLGLGEIVSVVGFVLMGKQIIDTVADLSEFYSLASSAKTEEELKIAGHHFAAAIASLGVAGLLHLAGTGKGREGEGEGRQSKGSGHHTEGGTEQSPGQEIEAHEGHPLVKELADRQALGEQHAHADGSVPMCAVLAETPATTVEERGQQIEELRVILAEVAREKNAVLSDLRPGHANVEGGVVSPAERATLALQKDALATEGGLINDVLDAKVKLNQAVREGAREKRIQFLRQNVEDTLRRYHQHLTMRKPDYARYSEDVDTGREFFMRYKMITGHGLTPREIADSRASTGELAMQELRVGFGGEDLGPLKKMAAEFNASNDAARDAGNPTDVSLIINTTKKKSGDPRQAEAMASVVDEWGKDPEFQRAVSGLDNAGVESADLPPTLLWKMSAKRTFQNARIVKAELRNALPEAQRETFLESLARVLETDKQRAHMVLDEFETADYDASLAEVNAKSAQEAITTTDKGQITATFAGQSIERVATATRHVTEALRRYRAEVGDVRQQSPQLGYTVHAGEQLKGMDPFELLRQVEQAVGLGADRIGHGLILGIDPVQLVRI